MVHYKLDRDKTGKLDNQSSVGVWLGKSLASDEHFLGTTRPEERRWEVKYLDGMVGLPSEG